MKMSIAWHEGCLKNQREYLERERQSLELHINKVAKLEQEVLAYQAQIATARESGRDGFDRERYGKPKEPIR